jgi:hypothetical protein
MHGCLELSLVLRIVPTPAGAPPSSLPDGAAGPGPATAPASADCSDSEGEEDGGGPVEPLHLPPPLEVELADVTLQGLTVRRLRTLLDPASALMRAHFAATGLSEVVVGPWTPPPPGGTWLRSRTVTYTKRLSIPLPLAPPSCTVWETHRDLTARGPAGFVVTHTCRNDAPKGDCFEAQVQVCAAHVPAPQPCARLRVSMALCWHKSTWGKGMVQGGAEADARRSWAALVNALTQAARSGGEAAASTAAATSEAAAVVPVGLPPAAEPGHRSWVGNVAAWPRAATCLQLALVAAVLLLAAAVWSVSLKLGRLTSALQAGGGGGLR